MNNKKLLRAVRWLSVGMIFQTGFLLAGSYSVYKKIMSKQSDKSKILEKTTTDRSIDKLVANRDFFDIVSYRDVYVKSRDDLILHGRYVENDSEYTAIVIHGYNSNAYRKGPIAKIFHDRGYNVLCPDLRAHGQSQGEMIGMGWPDHYDLLEWISLVNAIKPQGKIILYGVSMGGAAVLNATGEKLPGNVLVAIADCAFTSPWDLYKFQFKEIYNTPPRPLLDFVRMFNTLENKNDFRIGPVDMVKKSNTPTLFIHGVDDPFIPAEMSKKLYESCTSAKGLLLVEKGQHGRSYLADPKLYFESIFDFIKLHI